MIFRDDVQTYFLKPAELRFVREPAVIRTVLGSCVTVTMYCRRLGAAAACHPVLPVCPEVETCRQAACRQKYKYVECVLPEMFRKFLDLGARREEVETKLFGGANMFSRNISRGEILHVGSKNVNMARHMLGELKLELKSFDVGGNQGRKLYFDTQSGDVWVKRFQANGASRDELTAVQSQLTMQLKDYER
jgi:chemotaxis protein CheD